MKTSIKYFFSLFFILLSSPSFADYTAYTIVNAPGNHPTMDAACQSNADSNANYFWNPGEYDTSQGHHLCVIRLVSTGNVAGYPRPYPKLITGQNCPSPYENDGLNCVIPELTCPDGQFLEGGECQHGCVAGAEIKLVLPIEQVQSSTIDPILGCDLNMSETKKPECNFNTLLCNVYYVDSGNYNDLFDKDEEYEPLPELDPIPEPVSTETTNGPVVETEQNPDGSTTKTETTEITKVNDQGQTVEIIGDSIVLKNKEGEIIDILQQTTTNTFTDGSFSVTETTTTTATPNQVTEVKKNLTDGSTTVTNRTYKSGQSGTVVTTKTETFDSQGNSTGKTETTTGTIEQESGGEGEEGEEDYSYSSPPGKDGLYEKTDKTFESVLSNFVSQAQQAPFMAASSSFFTVTTGGTCPTWSIPEFWVFPAYPITAQCSPMMNQFWPLIAAVIMSLAAFQAFRWAFL